MFTSSTIECYTEELLTIPALPDQSWCSHLRSLGSRYYIVRHGQLPLIDCGEGWGSCIDFFFYPGRFFIVSLYHNVFNTQDVLNFPARSIENPLSKVDSAAPDNMITSFSDG